MITFSKITAAFKKINFPDSKWELIGYGFALLLPIPLGLLFGILLYKGEKTGIHWKRFFLDPGFRIIIFSIIWMAIILFMTLGKNYTWLYP